MGFLLKRYLIYAIDEQKSKKIILENDYYFIEVFAKQLLQNTYAVLH